MKIRIYYEAESDGESHRYCQDIPILIGKEAKDEFKSIIKGNCPTCGINVTHGYVTGERVPHCHSDDKPNCPEYYVYEKNAPAGSKNFYPLFDELITLSLKTKSDMVLVGDNIKGMNLGFKYVRIEVVYDELNEFDVIEGYEKVNR
ncbi:hypothetical protein [Methanobacterium sp.]|uniref:hypothetical protein n=1 Tax=Methanobacterium sp. TaxID=2164 RepID=UPI00315900B9